MEKIIMSDKITTERIELLHPKLRDEVREIYADICEALQGRAVCRFAYTLRTFEQQDNLFKKVPKVTNAKGGQSYHNYGLAVDIVLLIDKDNNGTYEAASWDRLGDYDGDKVSDWQEIVRIFRLYGWEWGGTWNTFPDYPHFQKTLGYSIKQLQRLHAAQGKPLYLDL